MVPGLSAELQHRVFAAASAFADLPQTVKDRYLMEVSPQFRGYSRAGRTEDFHFGPESVVESGEEPLWQRMQRGPNVWPDEVPEFRAAISELHERLGLLALELGHSTSRVSVFSLFSMFFDRI